jgi:spermidine synthase
MNGYNFLWIDGHMWMWDLPFEVDIQRKMADQCYGNVLVAGYGLGVVQRMLVENPKVNHVITIEDNKGVIDACIENFVGKLWGQIVCGDFFDFIPSIAKVNHIDQYDFVIGDIWPEIDPGQLHLYKKFKDKAERLLTYDGQMLCWGGDFYEYLLEKE